MRLQLLLAATAAAALCSGAAMAQVSDPTTQSSTPITNDPSTRTDDQCGANKGPKPCGAEVAIVPIPDDSSLPPPEPMASDSSTTTMYVAPPAASPEITTRLVTNGPVPDTPENRARFGGPDSNGGQRTAPVGND